MSYPDKEKKGKDAEGLGVREYKLLRLIKNNRHLLWDLSVNDFKTKYSGSYFGVFWAFFQPVITILVYWCVFEFGLKATPPVPGVMYIVWFSTGMFPWFFFSEGLSAVTNSFLEYSYLVKKVIFSIELLPVVKIISAFFVHLVFVCLLFVISLLGNNGVSVYNLQVFYYALCLTVLIYSLGRITSTILLFFRDLGQIVNIVLQIGVWATPIIWSYTIIPEKYQWIAKLNPLFYVVEGYRDSFIGKKWFWERPLLTIYFWLCAGICLVAGRKLFQRLRSHFADVL